MSPELLQPEVTAKGGFGFGSGFHVHVSVCGLVEPDTQLEAQMQGSPGNVPRAVHTAPLQQREVQGGGSGSSLLI